MNRIVFALGALLLLSACKDESPPHWAQVCKSAHDETRLVYGPTIYSHHSSLHTSITTVCDRYEQVCEPAGKDYKGTQTTCQ